MWALRLWKLRRAGRHERESQGLYQVRRGGGGNSGMPDRSFAGGGADATRRRKVTPQKWMEKTIESAIRCATAKCLRGHRLRRGMMW